MSEDPLGPGFETCGRESNTNIFLWVQAGLHQHTAHRGCPVEMNKSNINVLISPNMMSNNQTT